MNVKFSVIVPVHNGEKYIDELVSSILDQSGEGIEEPEIILVENGSDDVSPAICDRYAEEYENIKALHFGRIGAYNARREGMKAATGDYLLFADADDAVADSLLKELTNYVSFFHDRGKRADVIIYNAASYDSKDKRMFAFPFEENKVYSDKSDFYEVMERNDSLNALWNKAISAALAARLLEEDPAAKAGRSLNHGEDLLQTAQILDKAANIAFMDRILYFYRENNEGLTGSYHSDTFEDQIEAWRAFDEYAVSWSGDEFKEVISQRKTLTCSICIASLIYSELSQVEKSQELDKIMDSDFYSKYALLELPQWAPEESVFIQGLLKSDNPKAQLLASGMKHKVKSFVKSILRR